MKEGWPHHAGTIVKCTVAEDFEDVSTKPQVRKLCDVTIDPNIATYSFLGILKRTFYPKEAEKH